MAMDANTRPRAWWNLHRGIDWPVWLKLVLCAGADFWDFTFGRLFIGLSFGAEALSLVGLVFLWGPLGLLAAWEMLDVTEQIDAFIPTDVLVGLGVWLNTLRWDRPNAGVKSR